MLPFNRRWRKKFGLPFKRSKFKFFLGDTVKTAHLHLRKTYANVFLTLTDLNNKVIIILANTSSILHKTGFHLTNGVVFYFCILM